MLVDHFADAVVYSRTRVALGFPTFWKMTCLAVCAAILPSTSVRFGTRSPCRLRLFAVQLLASFSEISVASLGHLGHEVLMANRSTGRFPG